MARISTYDLDGKVTGGDKWIGTDSNSFNKTKNFTPIRLAEYFNSSEKIDSTNSLRFYYQIPDSEEERASGTISFETFLGLNIPLSDLNYILLSKTTEGGIEVPDFLNSLIDSRILLHKGDSMNVYGIYEITSIEDYEVNSNFLKISLSFIRGNGNLANGSSYLLSVIDFSLEEDISNHSQLNLDDGTNPHGTTKSDIGLGNVPNLDTTDAVNNSHTHTNKSILDLITEPFTTSLKSLYNSAVTNINNLLLTGERLITSSEITKLSNTSGTNSGDETTLSIQTKRPLKTVNGESLEGSGNVQIDYNDLENTPTLISNHSGLNLDDGTNPHGTTKGDLDLENVPNIDATNRANHTGTQLSTTISDLQETIEDIIGTKVKAGANVSVSYDDTTGETTISSTDNGEVNTASNIGTAGVGVFKQKTGANLEFKKINSGSNKVTITDDVVNNEVDINVVEANFTGIPQSAVTNLTTDISNKLDKSSTPSSVYATDAAGLQVMKPISEFQTDISGKLDKVTTAGVERVYTINTDGSQGTKPTSDFKDVLEFADFASFPATGESGKIYVALDIDSAYYWSGSTYVQIGGNEYLKKDIATYPIASFPLADTDKLLLWQGGVPKKLDKSDLYKQTTITVELMTNLTSDFYAPNDLIIHSTDIIRGSGTISLKVENVAYTLGQLITRGNKITVETTTPSVYNLNTTPTNTNWQRPADWLPMPTNITATDQTFVGLHAVIDNSDNYCAFSFTTSAGQYRVDWGDGNVTLHNSGTIAQHQYNYASVSNSTLSSRGYKQAMVKVTPVSGNLLTCNFQQRFVTTPVQNQAYSSGFLECILSMPNASSGNSIILGGLNIRHTYCEKVDIKTIGNATNLTSLFNNFYSLKSMPLFNTSNVTNMGYMFWYCYSLQSVPLFNTSHVTNMINMFAYCYSLKSMPLFNTSNVTNMSGMVLVCLSLNFIPAFITTAVTTDFTDFATNCNSLNRILMSFNRTVALQNCQLSKDALVEIFTNLVGRTSTTSATIDITGNWGASALTSADRLIATNKNWVITG